MNKRTKSIEVKLKVASVISYFFDAIDGDFENTDFRKMTDAELREMFLVYARDLSAWNENHEKVVAKADSVADSVVSLVRKVFEK